MTDSLDPTLLRPLEQTALTLARSAGESITRALSVAVSIRYKTAATPTLPPRDPVSDVDTAVESLVLTKILSDHPDHAFLGEESGYHGPPDAAFVWAVDPIDGTANFLHGFPLFASSIGILHRGAPVVGAVWCSTSLDLKPGVFHAHVGGELSFEGSPLRIRPRVEQVVTRLLGDPGKLESQRTYERRATGSAAVECAFVAARILGSAVFRGPHAWDVAGGLALVRAAKLPIYERVTGAWQEFNGFVAPDATDVRQSLAAWKGQLLVGLPGDPSELEGFVLQ